MVEETRWTLGIYGREPLNGEDEVERIANIANSSFIGHGSIKVTSSGRDEFSPLYTLQVALSEGRFDQSKLMSALTRAGYAIRI